MAPIRLVDTGRLASRGMRGHPLRFVMSVIGIAIGVAAMVAVAGIAQSSRVALDDQLDRLGTNLLTVVPAEDPDGEPTRLPAVARQMVGNIAPVTSASAVGVLSEVGAYRSPYVPTGQTSSVVVAAVDQSLVDTLHGQLARGSWFSEANQAFPTAVLGSRAAIRLGVSEVGTRLWIKGQWVVVVGILKPLDLASELDPAVMLPQQAALERFAADRTATSLYLRAHESQVVAVSEVLPATANPQHPELVSVSRPSDALAAKQAADRVLNRLLVALAGIGLLVGGIGVSNTMIIASMERRSEIGMRRALGATRGNIAVQFLAESMLMSVAGGAVGALAGFTITTFYAHAHGWHLALPLWVGLVATVLTGAIGAAAGLYPAVKASRVSPALALATP